MKPEEVKKHLLKLAVCKEITEDQRKACIWAIDHFNSGTWRKADKGMVEAIYDDLFDAGSDWGRAPSPAVKQCSNCGSLYLGECACIGKRYLSPVYCNHANECPTVCPCDAECYCKAYTCRPISRPSLTIKCPYYACNNPYCDGAHGWAGEPG